MSLIIWYRNRQLQKLNLQHHSDYKGWEGVERIALYFEATQIKEAEIEAWIQFFEAAGKNVEVLVYQSVKRKDLNPNWPYPSICKDDKSWWGWPSGLDFGTFKQHNFDLFFDFSKGEEPVHQIVAEKCFSLDSVEGSAHEHCCNTFLCYTHAADPAIARIFSNLS